MGYKVHIKHLSAGRKIKDGIQGTGNSISSYFRRKNVVAKDSQSQDFIDLKALPRVILQKHPVAVNLDWLTERNYFWVLGFGSWVLGLDNFHWLTFWVRHFTLNFLSWVLGL